MKVVLCSSITAAGSELTGYRDRAFNALFIGRGCLHRPQQEINSLANYRRHRNLPLGSDPLDAPRLFVGQLNLCANQSASSMLSYYAIMITNRSAKSIRRLVSKLI